VRGIHPRAAFGRRSFAERHEGVPGARDHGFALTVRFRRGSGRLTRRIPRVQFQRTDFRLAKKARKIINPQACPDPAFAKN
jgi:hypothetical protein